eukprot:2827688-Prorocentrum_lima.AAC.1
MIGECAPAPYLRVPGVREVMVERLITGEVVSRVETGEQVLELDGGDLHLLWDGFKHSDEAALHAGLRDLEGK